MRFKLHLIICTVICAITILFSTSPLALARIPYSYLNIGGLTPDQVINYTYEIYGRPTDTLIVKSLDGFSIYEATYNSELMVYYISGGYNEDRRVRAIVCSEDTISTNRGIKVGMNSDDVLSSYGQPDKTYSETNGYTWCYYSSSEDHPNMPMYFFFDKNNTIYTIVVGDIGYYY